MVSNRQSEDDKCDFYVGGEQKGSGCSGGKEISGAMVLGESGDLHWDIGKVEFECERGFWGFGEKNICKLAQFIKKSKFHVEVENGGVEEEMLLNWFCEQFYQKQYKRVGWEEQIIWIHKLNAF